MERPDISEMMKQRNQHKEMFAAAYLKATNIDPRDAVLIEQRQGLTLRWFFEPKKPDDSAMHWKSEIELLQAKLADARETLKKIGDVSYSCNSTRIAQECLERIGK